MAQVCVLKVWTMDAVVPSMQELVHLALDQLSKGMPEAVAAAAVDVDTVHTGTECYFVAVDMIEKAHNGTWKKSDAVL